MNPSVDPILLEVMKNRFVSLAEEMGAVLMRTAFSPNIKERRDFSCALFDADGQMVAQAAHIPVHLGSMPMAVAAALELADLGPGDAVLLNDPYRGGTHLPDITLVTPVFLDGKRPAFFLANRAHHADVGGMSAGSLPLSSEIFQEGLRIPPVRIVRGGELDRDLLRLLLANVRTPEEREGDLTAQLAANQVGERRLREILAQHGVEETRHYCRALLNYGERMMAAVIAGIPDGTFAFEDVLDDDGISDEPVRITCEVRVAGERAVVDFSDCAAQVPGCVNAVRAITLSAVFYAFRLLAPDEIAHNAGCMRCIEVITRPGTVADCTFPAAVAGGNVETSQRLVDVVLGALAKALPERIPAASCGSMNNLTLGGVDPRSGELFAYYETIAGGAGGAPQGGGASGIQTHMTNTLNTPIEALEHAYPLRVRRYELREGSGGAGRHPGGDGVIKEIALQCEARLTLLSDRRRSTPYGLNGGDAGRPGRNLLRRGAETISLAGKCSLVAKSGDVLVIETPGGGGWGSRHREEKS
ncbi:hydantoinase B/oxoprolinase family protein [Geoalkalibacter halelectricus]|uniref:Hydantoinase B/oxoprolinase family protein n=1 Tax=Geoalkalibacter halelectricus TaxID=2847045 RepID=A0ABY5ZIG0_9BACT|nr:hydantoinase B/oxoprolinase family protein [Geoalkalibacter halelectricus]MDO3380188.1 hydantoinase B/oxoprolinase family protein [Geoalkalibacter halelectricus]UWZ78239.1 hydantoinase B/oxoprolinase family protein [Geoalkalibacter halelectricus]